MPGIKRGDELHIERQIGPTTLTLQKIALRKETDEKIGLQYISAFSQISFRD
jgi:hypothetical protein